MHEEAVLFQEKTPQTLENYCWGQYILAGHNWGQRIELAGFPLYIDVELYLAIITSLVYVV